MIITVIAADWQTQGLPQNVIIYLPFYMVIINVIT